MFQITITIQDAIENRVINKFAKRHNYATILEDGSDNPETKRQFMKRLLLEYIKKSIKEVEVQEAVNVAAVSASASVDADIILS
jgi:hypothetical protein